MELTDPKLLYLLAALTLSFFLIVLIFWRKFSKTSPLAILGRVISILVMNVALIATVGVALNNYGEFYTSWGELLGRQTASTSIVERPSLGVTKQDLESAAYTKDGTAIIKKLIHGEKSGITAQVYFSLPKSYVETVQKGFSNISKYRVIEFFSGYPGHEIAWIHGFHIVDRLDVFTKMNDVLDKPEVIGVFPNINIVPKFDSECMDIPNGPQVETWLSIDVVNFTNNWLRLLPTRWGTAGYSTGGWCSVMLTLRHPDKYVAAAGLAGYYSPFVDRQVPSAISTQLKQNYDLNGILTNQPPPVSLFILNSTNDSLSNSSTQSLLKAIQSPINLREVTLTGAGHNFTAWRKVLDPMVKWFIEQFAGG